MWKWNFFLHDNSKKFPNLNFPPQLPCPYKKNHNLFWLYFLKSHLPDQQKSEIWGNLSKISHVFLRIEREDAILFFKILNSGPRGSELFLALGPEDDIFFSPWAIIKYLIYFIDFFRFQRKSTIHATKRRLLVFECVCSWSIGKSITKSGKNGK